MTIIADQDFVATFRRLMAIQIGWLEPSVVDCIRYVMQEIGELDSVLMKLGHQDAPYLRNHPEVSHANMVEEIAQAYLMLLTLANLLGVDLSEVLRQECQRMYCRFGGSGSLGVALRKSEGDIDRGVR